jgi:hypothetical protein
MASLEPLIAQRGRVKAAEAALQRARDEQRRLMLAAKKDRYRNTELASAMGLSRERVGIILKQTNKENHVRRRR